MQKPSTLGGKPMMERLSPSGVSTEFQMIPMVLNLITLERMQQSVQHSRL
jgi:hypothetical protein